MRYRPVFSDAAVTFFASVARRRQTKLLAHAEQFAAAPFVVPDFRTVDDEGREISHLLVDDFLFSYWIDHAARQIMIVDIEAAD